MNKVEAGENSGPNPRTRLFFKERVFRAGRAQVRGAENKFKDLILREKIHWPF